MDDMETLLEELEMEMDDSLGHLSGQLKNIQTGKATPAMLSSVRVDYYGTPTPLSQVANVNASDSKTLVIKPWEKGMLAPIEKGIFEANLGVTPMNDGEVVRIILPPMTQERRRDLVKKAKEEGENTKVSLRSIRQKAMSAIKREVKNGYPEDAGKKLEGEVDSQTKNFGGKVDKMIEAKEKDIMTI